MGISFNKMILKVIRKRMAVGVWAAFLVLLKTGVK